MAAVYGRGTFRYNIEREGWKSVQVSVCISPTFLKLCKFHKIGPWISNSGKLLSLYAVPLTISQGCEGGSLERPSSVLKGHLWMQTSGYLPDFSQAEIVIPDFAAI